MADRMALARAHIDRITGYSIQDDTLIRQALDTTGYFMPQSNRRLALLGDKALGIAIVDDWYSTGQPTGTASNLQRDIAENDNLARAGRAAGLGDHIIVNPGQNGLTITDKTMATAVEAVLGAIYLDSGKDISVIKSAMVVLGLGKAGAA